LSPRKGNGGGGDHLGIGRRGKLHGAAPLLHEEDKGNFAEIPLGFGDFLEILKTELFWQDLVIPT
jgi:hypothetical protein